MGILGYYRLVVGVAVRHSFSWAQFIIAIILFITGAAIWLAPTFGMTIDASDLVGLLRSPAFFVLGAPYWIWKDNQKEIVALKDDCVRRQRENRNKAKLLEFYAEVGLIIDHSLPKNISESDFQKYVEDAETWATNCADWIEQNMGAAAKVIFLDLTYMLAIHPREGDYAGLDGLI